MVQRHKNSISLLKNFNRVKFIIHSNTFAGSVTCVPTVCPKDRITLRLIDLTSPAGVFATLFGWHSEGP